MFCSRHWRINSKSSPFELNIARLERIDKETMETAGIVDAQHKGGEPLVFGITELADNTTLQLAELVGTVLVILLKLRGILFEDHLEG